jgi:hypothetical protein
LLNDQLLFLCVRYLKFPHELSSFLFRKHNITGKLLCQIILHKL